MTTDNSPDFDVRRYLAIVLKRKYVAIAVALSVLSVFTWGSFFLPKSYEASSTVFIERSSLIDPLIRGVGVSSNVDDGLRNIRNGITSRNMIERVIKKLNLDARDMSPAQYEEQIDGIRKKLKLTVSGSRGTDAFTISYTGGEPKTVQDLVNTLVGEYIRENLRVRKTDASGAYEFIEKQLLEYKKRLEDSDRAIREFRERNPQMVPQNEGTLLTRLEGFQASRIESEIRLKELVMKRNNLQRQLSGEKELTVAFVTREGSPQARLNQLNNQLMVLMTKYTDKYPEVIKVKSEIEEMKRQIAQAKDSRTESAGSETAAINPIYQQIKEELTRTDSEIESLRARSGELLRQQREAQGILGRMPKEQEEWSRLQRDRNVYQRIYDDLLQKLENARVSKDLEANEKSETFRVIDPAIFPSVPIEPNRVRMILLGVFLGLVSGIGVVFAMDHLTCPFKDETSIEAKLKLPVLATIPRVITESDLFLAKSLDRRVFTAAGIYLFVIGLLLVEEFIYRYMGIQTINF
jgi:polysaccharide chain length determinant protein (PEP-CTERM system associated)